MSLTIRGILPKSVTPMKANTLVTAVLALAGSSLLMAGEAESTNTTMTSQPASSYSDGGWFMGAGADYMFDAEEVFFNGHFGYDFGSGSSLFVEAGWISNEDSGFPAVVDVDIDIDIETDVALISVDFSIMSSSVIVVDDDPV